MNSDNLNIAVNGSCSCGCGNSMDNEVLVY